MKPTNWNNSTANDPFAEPLTSKLTDEPNGVSPVASRAQRRASNLFDQAIQQQPLNDSRMIRGRAETFSYSKTLNEQNANLPAQQPTHGIASRSTRARAGSLTLPSAALTDAFGPSIFSAPWEPEASIPMMEPSTVNPFTKMDSPILDPVNPFGISGKQVEINPDAMARAFDYLGLDDPVHDSFEPTKMDPFIEPFKPNAAAYFAQQRTMGHMRVRSLTTNMNPMVKGAGPVSMNRPRSLSIPTKDPQQVYMDTYDYSTKSSPIRASPAVSDDVNNELSRSLWIGNLDSSIVPQDILPAFSVFGPIDSLKMLPEKDCAFINFVHLEDALKAKDAMQGAQIRHCIIKLGFGKTDSNDSNPTKSVWVGNLPSNIESSEIEAAFNAFGTIESIKILPHKNCGFVNFYKLEEAIDAKKRMNGKEIRGYVIKTGYAKVPFLKDSNSSQIAQFGQGYQQGQQAEWEGSSFNHSNGQQMYWQQEETNGFSNMFPPLPDIPIEHRIDSNRMRDFRKRLEAVAVPIETVNEIFNVIIHDAPLSSADYIGNVVVQKLMEKGTHEQKLAIIQQVGPYMATIGVHKNGTWAVQKMIDLASTPEQIQAICDYIAPFTAPLLLDQFGNYVVQCCLRFDNERNQFIFDAIAANMLEVGMGRFGARAIRTCLESQYTSKRQQKIVAQAIIQHSNQLSLDPNGSLLVGWLLDTSTLPGRFTAIVPVFNEHIVAFCTHKFASSSILKIFNQKIEPEARQMLLAAIFVHQILAQILSDTVNGVNFIRKIVTSCSSSAEEEGRLSEQVRLAVSQTPELLCSPLHRRLVDDLCGPHSLSPTKSEKDEIVSPLTPRAQSFHPMAFKTPDGSLPTPMSTPL